MQDTDESQGDRTDDGILDGGAKGSAKGPEATDGGRRV